MDLSALTGPEAGRNAREARSGSAGRSGGGAQIAGVIPAGLRRSVQISTISAALSPGLLENSAIATGAAPLCPSASHDRIPLTGSKIRR